MWPPPGPLVCTHWAFEAEGIIARRMARLTEELNSVFMTLPPVDGREGPDPQRGFYAELKGKNVGHHPRTAPTVEERSSKIAP